MLPRASLAACALTLAACAAPEPAPVPILVPVPAPAQDGGALPQPTAPAPDPRATDFDWIRLVSDEWLKGEVVGLRDGDFEFESDKLDTLKLDWDDVAELRSPRVHTILIAGRRSLVGRLSVLGDRVVLSDGEELALTREDLLAIVPGEPSEWNAWSGRVGLGMTTRKGNTNQSDASAFLHAKRETAATRWATTYNGALSRVEGIQTADNHRVDGRFDWFLSERLFLTPASLQYFRDPFQNIRRRLTPAAGVGYDILASGEMDLSLFVGPAWQHVVYESAEPGEPDSDGTAAGLAIVGYSFDITPDVELALDYNVTVPLPDTASYNSRLSAAVEVDLIWDLDLEVRFVWDRVNDPRPDETGARPEKDDFRTTVGLGWEF